MSEEQELPQNGGRDYPLPPHVARMDRQDKKRLVRIRELLEECADLSLEHVKKLLTDEDDQKRTRGAQLYATLSPSIIKTFELGEYEARLAAVEEAQRVARARAT